MILKNNLNCLNPWFVVGLTDAEPSFGVIITKDVSRPLGFVISISFEIGLNKKDLDLLNKVKNTLGVGNIYFNKDDNTYKFKVSNITDINNIIIPFFKKYSLMSQKRADFEVFVKIIDIMLNKGHLTSDGLQEIVNLKASLNLGLSDKLKASFPNYKVSPTRSPVVSLMNIPNDFWLAGFFEGEACFYVSVYKSPNSKTGFAVQLVFKVTQHSRDAELLKHMAKHLSCGRVEYRKGEACDYTVTAFKDIKDKIIPLLNKYPLLGSKALNFKDFKKVVEIMENKDHLTEKGINDIRVIKENMNTGRLGD